MSPVEFFSDHTYRMVFLATALIGLVSGALGVFAYLRRQSLVSDVISHAALPGTLVAFLVGVVLLGTDGRSMVGLVTGAVVAGTLAVLWAASITRHSRLKVDTSMAVVLTTFFAGGMLLLQVITRGDFRGKGGIEDYLFGNASVITTSDLVAIIVVGIAALAVLVACWKEFALHAFDPDHASVLGFDRRVVDTVMFTSIVVATVIGVKAVGLVLMVAFVVTPPAAARQWTRRLPSMVVLSAAIGAVTSGVGAYLSIAVVDVPTGPLVVMVMFAVFVVSMLAAPRRSILVRAIGRARLRDRLRRELLKEQA
ncbi:metal ABC transporter permease [Aestuariimicrobium sp. Y1814]|uniref:metal ABC transporter permease n=1 Tax=Aestuariimicrobium sp. Y1814 TaxID=3418742 RepID=UPI003DA6E40C